MRSPCGDLERRHDRQRKNVSETCPETQAGRDERDREHATLRPEPGRPADGSAEADPRAPHRPADPEPVTMTENAVAADTRKLRAWLLDCRSRVPCGGFPMCISPISPTRWWGG